MLKQTKASILLSALLAVAGSGSAMAAAPKIDQLIARHGADDRSGDDRRGRHATEQKDQLARHGADDPFGDDLGDDHGGRRS